MCNPLCLQGETLPFYLVMLRFSIFIATELLFTLFVLIDSVGLRDCLWPTHS
jgi:hypothetical protein